MEVILDYTQWQAIVPKSVQSQLPRVLYYRAALPCGIATLWPVPSQDGQLVLYTPGLVDEVEDINNEVEFPKGYREFVEYELACKVHDRYPTAPMLPSVEVRARDYKARIKAAQQTPLFISSDPAALGPNRTSTRRTWGAREWY